MEDLFARAQISRLGYMPSLLSRQAQEEMRMAESAFDDVTIEALVGVDLQTMTGDIGGPEQEKVIDEVVSQSRDHINRILRRFPTISSETECHFVDETLRYVRGVLLGREEPVVETFDLNKAGKIKDMIDDTIGFIRTQRQRL